MFVQKFIDYGSNTADNMQGSHLIYHNLYKTLLYLYLHKLIYTYL